MGKGKLLIMDSQAGGVFELSDIAGNIRLHQVWNDGASTPDRAAGASPMARR